MPVCTEADICLKKKKRGNLLAQVRGALESILTWNITKALEKVVKTAQNISGTIYRASVISVKWAVCTGPKGY